MDEEDLEVVVEEGPEEDSGNKQEKKNGGGLRRLYVAVSMYLVANPTMNLSAIVSMRNCWRSSWMDGRGVHEKCLAVGPGFEPFRKPYLTTWGSYFGQCLCLFFTWRSVFKKSPKSWLRTLPPTLMDMVSVTCMFMSMSYVSASVMQMLKGMTIFFTALFSIAILKRSLTKMNWLGIVLAMIGVTAVALSVFVGGKDIRGNWLGLLLVTISSTFSSASSVLKEQLLIKYDFTSEDVVSMGGFVGFLLSTLLVLLAWLAFPGNDHHSVMENLPHSFSMLGSNLVLVFLTIVPSTVGTALNNYAKVECTRLLSSVVTALLGSICTMIIWIIETIMHYSCNMALESELNGRSFIKGGGFLLIIVSIVIYRAETMSDLKFWTRR
jgi:drug/metabolite transporter (DMT)-like permease